MRNAILSIHWFEFLLMLSIVWRVTQMLINEDGPYRVFDRLREFAWRNLETGEAFPKGSLAFMFSCFRCMSVIVAALTLATYLLLPLLIYPVGVICGLSTAAIAVEESLKRVQQPLT